MNVTGCTGTGRSLAALALVVSVACGISVAQSEPSKVTTDIEQWKQIALQPGRDIGEKRHAVRAIRDAGGELAVAALLDLLGTVEPKEVGQSVISCLGDLGGEEAKRGLARTAADPLVGDRAINQLERMISAKDEAILKEVLAAIRDKADKLPVANLAEAARLFGNTSYKPAAPFVRQMISHDDIRVKMPGLRAMGSVGEQKDTIMLWQVVADSAESPDRRVLAAAFYPIGQLGSNEDYKRLLSFAESIRKASKPGDSRLLLLRDIMQARAAIHARAAEPAAPAVVAVKAARVPGGAEIEVQLPDHCVGLLVTISSGDQKVAHGLVQGKVVKLALPAGSFSATLRPIVPISRGVMERFINTAAHVYEPEQMLQLGEPLKVEALEAEGPPATAPSVANAVSPLRLDNYAQQVMDDGGAKRDAAAIVVLRGTMVGWPGKEDSGLSGHQVIPTTFVMRRGTKLVDTKGSIYMESVSMERHGAPSRGQTIVVGQLCRAWDGTSYIFLALGAWPADVEAGATGSSTTSRPSDQR